MCYGTCAYWLGKKADEYHSHKWTVYLREPEHGDLSHVISKVVFNLHPSFKEPTRVPVSYTHLTLPTICSV